ncbi:hypothetical protein ABZP36_005132 [Zizania latifolia]
MARGAVVHTLAITQAHYLHIDPVAIASGYQVTINEEDVPGMRQGVKEAAFALLNDVVSQTMILMMEDLRQTVEEERDLETIWPALRIWGFDV